MEPGAADSNFMDFTDDVDLRRRSSVNDATASCIARPQLPADRQTVYEDTDRSAQVIISCPRLVGSNVAKLLLTSGAVILCILSRE